MGFNIFTIDNDDLNIARGVSAGCHLVSALILMAAWGLAKRDDGGRQDLVYPLYTAFTSWTDPDFADPFLTGKGIGADGSSVNNGYLYNRCRTIKDYHYDQCHRPEKECDQPKALEFTPHTTLTPAFKDSGTMLSLHWVVVIFFLVSAFFQTVAVTATANDFILPSTIRFIEHSITTPLMTVAIALQIGIMHTHSLLIIATLSWACMMAGLCCEKTRLAKATIIDKNKITNDDMSGKEKVAESKTIDELRKVIFFTQAAGWVMLGITFYVIVGFFHASQQSCDSPETAPNFIWAIVYGQIISFVLFGLMQVVEIVGALSAEQADLGYIVLSLMSKTYLGWMIYGGNFAQK